MYGMIASGKLSCHRIGNGRGAIRVRRDDLEQFLADCRFARSEPVTPRPAAEAKTPQALMQCRQVRESCRPPRNRICPELRSGRRQ